MQTMQRYSARVLAVLILAAVLAGATFTGLNINDLGMHNARTSSGMTFNDAAITNAITAIAGANKQMLLPPGTWSIANNLTVPSNVFSYLPAGTTISVGAAKTLTLNGATKLEPGAQINCNTTGAVAINGPFDAPLQQVFTNCPAGQVTGLDLARPEHWGGAADNSTINTTAIQAAFGAVGATGTVEFQTGTYLVDDRILRQTNGINLQGHGSGTIIKLADSTVANLIETDLGFTTVAVFVFYNTTDVTVENLTLDGNKANNSSTNSGDGLNFYNVTRARVSNVYAHDWPRDAIAFNRRTPSNTSIVEVDNVVSTGNGHASMTTGGEGLLVLDGQYVTINNYIGRDNLLANLKIDTLTSTTADLAVSNIVVEGSRSTDGMAITGTPVRVTASNIVTRNNYRYGFYIAGSTSLTDVSVSNLQAFDNGQDGSSSGIVISTPTRIVMTGGISRGNAGRGIEISAGTELIISAFELSNNVGQGLNATSATGAMELTGLVVQGNTDDGMILRGGPIGVNGGTIRNNGGDGITLVTANPATLTGAKITGNGGHGIRFSGDANAQLSITACQIHANGQTTHNTFDGILVATGSTDVIISDSRVYRGAGANQQRYGINLGAGTRLLVVHNNLNEGGATAALTGVANGTVRDNVGFVTESSGTGTVANGATTAVVTHGLSLTPAAKDCSIVFTEQPTNATTYWYLSTFTSTQFTLNVNNPGASNLDFAWRCAVY